MVVLRWRIGSWIRWASEGRAGARVAGVGVLYRVLERGALGDGKVGGRRVGVCAFGVALSSILAGVLEA